MYVMLDLSYIMMSFLKNIDPEWYQEPPLAHGRITNSYVRMCWSLNQQLKAK